MKPRPILSGWCMSANHDRCAHHIQHGTTRRPDLWCACPCHLKTVPR